MMPPDLIAQIRAAWVRDADNPARQGLTIRQTTTTSVFNPLYTVPAGKILVLESMNCSGLADSFYAAIFQGPLQHGNIVLSAPSVGENSGVLIAESNAKVYLSPGTVLNLRMFTNDALTCTVTGYLVDANPV